jgi:Flp pilus assembly CpaF family ATPase
VFSTLAYRGFGSRLGPARPSLAAAISKALSSSLGRTLALRKESSDRHSIATLVAVGTMSKDIASVHRLEGTRHRNSC